MCGIVGYIGNRQAAPLLLDGLSKLEYRGYDSAGICIHNKDGLQVHKAKGRLQVLADRVDGGAAVSGQAGIGHTRWATHGAPSDVNSHPHLSCSGKIALVHNGIIENEARLRQQLLELGLTFRSETDTEVAANLIGHYYEVGGDFLGAVRQAVAKMEGSFALGILCLDLPGTMVAVKKDSPLIFGFGEGEHFIASDVPAILKHTRTVTYMDDGEMVMFNDKDVTFYDPSGAQIEKKKEVITWEMSAAERDGYDHFMLKEIYEQPRALRDTLLPHIKDGKIVLDGIELPKEYLQQLRKICFVACGSAYYVSMLAKYIIEKNCRISVETMMGSEFRYSDPVIGPQDLVIVISQSGETADSLAALREAKRRGARTLAIVNVVGSAIAKAADQVIYTCAGPEIAVATTKAFSAQLAVIYLLTLHIASALECMEKSCYDAHVQMLRRLPEFVHDQLSAEKVEMLKCYARKYYRSDDAFFIGRNMDSAICQEGSLKLKEIGYVHSEAYPAGELKHGSISLIEDGTLVVAVATVEALFDKTIANVREVRARGADVLCVALEKFAAAAAETAQVVIPVPEVLPMLQPSINLIPLQIFAYYVAVERGCDVDKPRNLAKSVTVE